jgi:hypothetical protein
MNAIYFSLTPHTYAARFDHAIIILDSTHDKYVSFIDAAAHYFKLALSDSFARNRDGKLTHINNDIDLEQLNYWITYFIENNFIVESSQAHRKLLAPLPLQPGGLAEYKWDHKPSWQPFSKTSKIQILKAFFTLARIHYLLKLKGIAGILNTLKKASSNQAPLHQPTDQEINKLAAAIDSASMVYPKKTYCLAWASTFVLLALKKNWSCSLVIGIQTNPFYAHAWAQTADTVIHDDPAIAKVLSIILKEPHT